MSKWPTPRADERDQRNGYTRPDGAIALSLAAKRWPTPDGSLFNDGQAPEAFEARRSRLAERGINGNGAGIPLAVEAVRFTNEASPTWPTPRTKQGQTYRPKSDGRTGLTLEGRVARWPTPREIYGEHRGMVEGHHLTGQAIGMYRTPDAHVGHYSLTGPTQRSQNLEAKARRGELPTAPGWPTPQSRDWRSGEASDETAGKNARPLNEAAVRSGLPVPPTAKGGTGSSPSGPTSLPPPSSRPRLNPRFVEWLQGLPPGWTDVDVPLGTTDCVPWVTQFVLPKRRSR